MKATIRLLMNLVAFGMLTACSCPVMSPCYFAEIVPGDSIDDVVRCAGCPYEICKGCDGAERYVFVTRELLAPGVRRFTHYIVTVKDGVVLDKCISDEEYQRMFFDRDVNITE